MKRLDLVALVILVLTICACSPEAATPSVDTSNTAPDTSTTTSSPLSSQRLPHYRLWNIETILPPIFPHPTVPILLADRLTGGSWWPADVKGPEYLANPVAKKHGAVDVGYKSSDPHYVMYEITATKPPPAPVTVNDQFTKNGTWEFERKYRLLVPAAKDLNDNAGNPPQVDHFVCVAVSTKTAKMGVITATVPVTLTDQFQPWVQNPDGDELLKLTPAYFCAAASKDHQGQKIAQYPNDRLAIYRLSRYATTTVTPWTRDQFGQLHLDVERGDLLAVPQEQQ